MYIYYFMNYIEKFRLEQRQSLEEYDFKKGDLEIHLSPSKQFSLKSTTLWAVGTSQQLTRVEVYNENPQEQIFDFLVNESQFFFGWETVGNVEYLICAEDIFGGQTVIDLTNRKMAGYSPNEDGFIWTSFHLSPNGKTLAVIGCYWACAYVIKLFDFSDPLNLPLPEIKEIELLDNDESITGWLNNETLKMKGIKRQRVPQYFADGSFRMQTLSEVQAEREINVFFSA